MKSRPKHETEREKKMALINKLRKNGYTMNEAKAAIIKCYNAVVRNMENGNGDITRTMRAMLNVEPIYIPDLFAVGKGKCYAAA